jgi:hypothetical protein
MRIFRGLLVRRLPMAAAVGALGVATLGAGPAGAGECPATGIGFQLPGCLVTHVPQANSSEGATCLAAAPGGMDVSTAGVTLTIFENGPYGSDEMYEGEAWNTTASWYVELDNGSNDRASAWQSYCTDGNMFETNVNEGGGAYFPANSTGNFPFGGVPNDQLSAVAPFNSC